MVDAALGLALRASLGTYRLTHVGIVVTNSSYLVQVLDLLTLLVDLDRAAGVVYNTYGATIVLKEALLLEGL